jgi:hypothetical protein
MANTNIYRSEEACGTPLFYPRLGHASLIFTFHFGFHP